MSGRREECNGRQVEVKDELVRMKKEVQRFHDHLNGDIQNLEQCLKDFQ